MRSSVIAKAGQWTGGTQLEAGIIGAGIIGADLQRDERRLEVLHSSDDAWWLALHSQPNSKGNRGR